MRVRPWCARSVFATSSKPEVSRSSRCTMPGRPALDPCDSAVPRATSTFTSESSQWPGPGRSEEHTSELQSRPHLVCRLLLEKKKNKKNPQNRDDTTHRPTRQKLARGSACR